MTTYVTIFSRSLTSYSYMIGAIVKKLFSKTHIYCINHCWTDKYRAYRGHCGSELPQRTYHCGRSYGGHCGSGLPKRPHHCG